MFSTVEHSVVYPIIEHLVVFPIVEHLVVFPIVKNQKMDCQMIDIDLIT